MGGSRKDVVWERDKSWTGILRMMADCGEEEEAGINRYRSGKSTNAKRNDEMSTYVSNLCTL